MAKKKNGKAATPAAPAPIMVTKILYVFSNGDVVAGTPQSLQIAQLDGTTVEARNVISNDGKEITYTPVARFENVRLQVTELTKAEAAVN